MKIKTKDLKEFSLIWAVIFTIIGIIPYFKHTTPQNWAFGVSLIFIMVAFFKPNILESFYKIWTKFGGLMGHYISKVILFVLYFGLFTPISLLLKLLGKDLLDKKIDKDADSYWIERENQPESMKFQF